MQTDDNLAETPVPGSTQDADMADSQARKIKVDLPGRLQIFNGKREYSRQAWTAELDVPLDNLSLWEKLCLDALDFLTRPYRQDAADEFISRVAGMTGSVTGEELLNRAVEAELGNSLLDFDTLILGRQAERNLRPDQFEAEDVAWLLRQVQESINTTKNAAI